MRYVAICPKCGAKSGCTPKGVRPANVDLKIPQDVVDRNKCCTVCGAMLDLSTVQALPRPPVVQSKAQYRHNLLDMR